MKSNPTRTRTLKDLDSLLKESYKLRDQRLKLTKPLRRKRDKITERIKALNLDYLKLHKQITDIEGVPNHHQEAFIARLITILKTPAAYGLTKEDVADLTDKYL